jgi:type II secretory pathway pseudopilin PulG
MKSSIMQIKKFILSKKVVLGLSAGFLLILVGGVAANHRSAQGSTQSNNTSQSALNQYQNTKNSGDTVQSGEQAQTNQPSNTGTSKNNNPKIQTTTSKLSTPKTSTTVDTNCLIKAKTAKNGKKIFYLPNNTSYSRVKATQCFKTADEAVAAGYQNVSQ